MVILKLKSEMLIFFLNVILIVEVSLQCQTIKRTNKKEITLFHRKSLHQKSLHTTSRRGLVVNAEDPWPRGPGFKSPLWRPFFRHHSFGSKLGTIIVEKTLTWHCCMYCNPANGRVDFEEWSAYKIQLHGTEWIVSLSGDWDQSPKKIN